MNDRQLTLGEAAQISGMSAENLHGMIQKGEIPGIAVPGNREMGTVSEATLEALIASQRRKEPQAVPMQLRRDFYQTVPLEQVAADLGMTVREVEGLLFAGKLEGSYLHPRWTGVKAVALAIYREQVGGMA